MSRTNFEHDDYVKLLIDVPGDLHASVKSTATLRRKKFYEYVLECIEVGHKTLETERQRTGKVDSKLQEAV